MLYIEVVLVESMEHKFIMFIDISTVFYVSKKSKVDFVELMEWFLLWQFKKKWT